MKYFPVYPQAGAHNATHASSDATLRRQSEPIHSCGGPAILMWRYLNHLNHLILDATKKIAPKSYYVHGTAFVWQLYIFPLISLYRVGRRMTL